MKKLALLLFMAGLIVIGFTNTNCTRRSENVITPIGGDTQKTVTTIDSSGEDIHVSVFEGSTANGAPSTDGAEVYLVKNFTDYTQVQSGNFSSKYIDSLTTDANGNCTFPKSKKLRPASGTYYPQSAGAPYYGERYDYYVYAKWKNKTTSVIETGWYSFKNDNHSATNPNVAINNGLNNAGLALRMYVTP